MGAQTTHHSAASTTTTSSSSSRRAKPFVMDEQTRFLYLILKQLDLKTVNWQQVADDLGIKNGHAARMRWSRFRCHVEGVPAANNKRRDERKGKGVNAKNAMTSKRGCVESGHEEANDAKRVKMEQGWAAMPGGYGQPPPPPPYYPVDPSYGILPPHHPSFGPLQPALFGLQPHGPSSYPSQPLTQSFGPAPPPPGTLNPADMANPNVSATVKADVDSQPAHAALAEPRDDSRPVLVKYEEDGDLPQQAGSAPSSSEANTELSQRDQMQNSTADPALPCAPGPARPPTAAQDAHCTASDHGQQQEAVPRSPGGKCQDDVVKSERKSIDDMLTEAPLLLAEVSKEDFTKAVDAEAAAIAEVGHTMKSQPATPRQEEPPSPEIPLATVKAQAQALRQQEASMDTHSSAQVPPVSVGAIACPISGGASSQENSPPSKLQPLTTAAASVLPQHQTRPAHHAGDLQPAPDSALPRAAAPALPMTPASLNRHSFNPSYALPNGGYFHPVFPNYPPHPPASHPFWHHAPFVPMNNLSPSPYPLPHPAMTPPPPMIPDWNDGARPFGQPSFPQGAVLYEYGRPGMPPPATQPNFNLGALATTYQASAGQEQGQATSTAVAGSDEDIKGLKITSDANMDLFVPSIDEFDPLGFDFQVGKDTPTGMAARVPMEPQHVLRCNDESAVVEHVEHDKCGSGVEKDGGTGQDDEQRVDSLQ